MESSSLLTVLVLWLDSEHFSLLTLPSHLCILVLHCSLGILLLHGSLCMLLLHCSLQEHMVPQRTGRHRTCSLPGALACLRAMDI